MTRRILQVVGAMERGGISNWLMQLVRRLDGERYRFDFLLHEARPEAHDDELRRLGCRLIHCTDRRPWRYAGRFGEVVRVNGPYDVVHSHVYRFSGVVMRLAAHHRIPIRIAHSHTDRRAAGDERGLPRKLYLTLMRRWIRRHATVRLATSRRAAEALFGPDWPNMPATRVLYCGVDFAPFEAPSEPAAAVRAALGRLPADVLVIGHVGQFKPAKNHALLLEIAARAMSRDPRVHLLLVGDGPLRPGIEARARDLGIAERVVFAGGRDDVPRLMLGAMDVFVFPSLFEGLGLVLLEAQAAGLPCVLADHISGEVDVVPGLMHRLPLEAPPEQWASALFAAGARRAAVSRAEALAAVEGSPFNITRTVQAFARLYDGDGP